MGGACSTRLQEKLVGVCRRGGIIGAAVGMVLVLHIYTLSAPLQAQRGDVHEFGGLSEARRVRGPTHSRLGRDAHCAPLVTVEMLQSYKTVSKTA